MRYHLELGDALDFLPTLTPGTVDAVITDPPYSSGGFTRGDRMQDSRTKYVSTGAAHMLKAFGGDSRDQRGYLAWCTLWLAACYRACKPGALACVFTDWRQLPTTSDAFQAAGFVWRGAGVWDKKNGRPVLGRFQQRAEFVVWGTKGPRPTAGPCGHGVYAEATPPTSKRLHITEKPVGVMEWLLTPVVPGGLILDPFAGSGSTGVAALRTGREFLGCEMDPDIHAAAAKRLAFHAELAEVA